MKRWIAAFVIALATAGLAAEPLLITGAGATFPYPLYSKWFSEYNKLHPDIRFNYQSIGSGGGIRQMTEKTVDFGATDAPMTDEELHKGPTLVHIPTVLGAVVVVYNVPGVPALRLSPGTLAGIFLGKITHWNDPELLKDNPGAKLPASAITVAHRADGSGTTAIFTDYLAKVSPDWKGQVGSGKSVKWPVGLGGKGNEGVTGHVKTTEGAIGYVELAYANQNHLTMASLKNKSGAFVKPSLESTTAAAAGVTLPEDFRVSITDPAGATAYPISSFTYLLVDRTPKDAQKGAAIVRFLSWAVHDGQKLAPALDYAPLPAPVVTRVDQRLGQLGAGAQIHGSR
jgi:phosphate transport system substrate-binding protein